MARILTDEEIANLLNDEKPLPPDWERRLSLRQKRRYQYEGRLLDVVSGDGHHFRFIVRRNRQNLLDFSIILVFEDEDGSEYRLIRYNGNIRRGTRTGGRRIEASRITRSNRTSTYTERPSATRGTATPSTDMLRPQMTTPTTVRRSTPS